MALGTASRGASRRLRVGVVLESVRCPAWIRAVLTGVVESEFASLEAVVVVPATARPPVGSGGALLRVVEALDERWLGAGPDALVRSELSDAPLESAITGAAAGQRLSELNLDVVLALDTPPTGLERCAAAGVWSVLFAAAERDRDAPRYFWELRRRNSIVETAIRADAGTGSRILYRSRSAPDPVSLHRTRSVAAWKAARALLLRLEELQAPGLESLLGHADEVTEPRVSSPSSIRTWDVVRLAFGMGRSGLVRFLDRWLRRGEWFVAYRRRQDWPPWQSDEPHVLLDSPSGRFLADPFVHEHDGRHIVFVEDFVEADGKAVISWLEVTETGAPTSPHVALERDYHLSYPFVFDWDGDVFMIPESSAARRVDLYRADPFPGRWTLIRTLLNDVVADDATLLRHDGRFWLFAGIAPDGTGAAHGELFLYSAESLDTDWVPHPWNPIVTDVRSSRPAGAIFAHEGAWIRPAQDGSRRYGYATVLNRIELLTTSAYREQPVARIDPDWLAGNLSTHTYNRDGTYEVVDGFRRLWRRPSRRG